METQTSELFVGWVLGAVSAVFAWLVANMIAAGVPEDEDDF